MLTVDIQNASSAANIPSDEQLRLWVASTLGDEQDNELSIRIVDCEEIRALNHQYRHKNQPTNVLSFPCELPPGIDVPLLGDIVICAQVVQDEAAQQHKTELSHWAHMVVHGTLHLLGYDHMDDAEADEMESLEIEILATLGFPNPYIEPQHTRLEHS